MGRVGPGRTGVTSGSGGRCRAAPGLAWEAGSTQPPPGPAWASSASSSPLPPPQGHRFPCYGGRKLTACLQEQLGLVPSAVAGRLRQAVQSRLCPGEPGGNGSSLAAAQELCVGLGGGGMLGMGGWRWNLCLLSQPRRLGPGRSGRGVQWRLPCVPAGPPNTHTGLLTLDVNCGLLPLQRPPQSPRLRSGLGDGIYFWLLPLSSRGRKALPAGLSSGWGSAPRAASSDPALPTTDLAPDTQLF